MMLLLLLFCVVFCGCLLSFVVVNGVGVVFSFVVVDVVIVAVFATYGPFKSY